MKAVPKTKSKIELLLINLIFPQLVGFLSSTLAGDIGEKYNSLIRPAFAPPSFIFPIAWITIYLLTGYAAYRISSGNFANKKYLISLYLTQLLINFLWTIFFFGLDLKFFSIIWLIFLIIFVVLTAFNFYKADKLSGLLFIPYIAWCLFALYITIGVWILN